MNSSVLSARLCRRLLCLSALFACWVVVDTVDAASPTLNTILPRGGQRGTEIDVTFDGRQLADGEEILYYEPGIETVKLEAKGANQLQARLKIAADCTLGEHTLQVRTKSGISDYRTFWVGPFPNIDEKEPNTDFASPQKVPLNSTLVGRITNEDVDYFLVEAKKGQRISVEVEGLRLGTTMFDPYVAILDQKRFELASEDDAPLLRQDAFTSAIAPADGNYVIELRESSYGGSNSSYYRLHIGTFPRPSAIFPPGGKAGTEVEVTFKGDITGDVVRKTKLPADITENFQLSFEDQQGLAPSEIPFRLSAVDNVLEKEPNDGRNEATPAELPLAMNGIIQAENDSDWFKFSAKKDQQYDVTCIARTVRSPLDPVMNIYDANGKRLAGNDDNREEVDSYVRFKAPADGDYFVLIQDHLHRGGPTYVYRIEFEPVQPKLVLGIPRNERYKQTRQQIFVPRGSRFATQFSISRSNFGGEVVFDGSNLPPGITMHAKPAPANMSTWPVVYEAAADAPIGGKLLKFTAKCTEKNQNVVGHFQNRADFIIAAPNQSLFSWKDVDQLAVAVVEELPFTIAIEQPGAPLVRNGSLRVKIVVNRKEGFNEPLTVQFPFRPPGVGTTTTIKIDKGQSEGYYTLNANGNAALGEWPVYALGYANAGGTAFASSQLATLTVAEPYLDIAMQRSAVEQGQPVQMVGEVKINHPFEGNAKVRLLGLPAQVTAPELEINKETKQVVFPIVTTPEARPGRHKTVFCQVIVPEHNMEVIHSVGQTELRIDKPLPKPTKTPEPEKKTAEKKPEPKKPAAPKQLSRLEQLRLEAKQAQANAK